MPEPAPDPRIVAFLGTVQGRLFDEGLRHSVALHRYQLGLRRRVLATLNDVVFPDLFATAQARLERIGSRGRVGGRLPWTTQRYKDLAEATAGVIRGGFAQLGVDYRSELRGLAATEAEWQTAALHRAIPSGLSVGFRQPNLATVRAVTLSAPLEGEFVAQQWTNLSRKTQQLVNSEMIAGLANGEPVPQIVRRLRGTSAAAFRNGTAGWVRRQATTLVRTQATHVSAHARELTYAENADLIKAVRYVATLDARTTEICISLDGRVFPIGEGERPPMHHQCRSTTVPELESAKELGIDLSKLPASTRAAFGGPVDMQMSGVQWLRAQPAAAQNEILGKGRAQLFRSGNLDLGGPRFRRLFDQDNRLLGLAELRRLAGLPAA
jgi:SPP1 gp7 family putative phage head morphogenesis protein